MRIEAFMFLVGCTKLELVRLYQSPACSNWQRLAYFTPKVLSSSLSSSLLSQLPHHHHHRHHLIIVMNITIVINIIIIETQHALIDSGLAYFTPWLLFGLGWSTIRGWGNRLILVYQCFCVFCHAVWAHCNLHILRVYEYCKLYISFGAKCTIEML